jgi:hypothetical protein
MKVDWEVDDTDEVNLTASTDTHTDTDTKSEKKKKKKKKKKKAKRVPRVLTRLGRAERYWAKAIPPSHEGDMIATLRPSIAWLLLRLAEPRPGIQWRGTCFDVVLDVVS